MISTEQTSNISTVGEPKHVQGHSTAVIKVNENLYMCPECGITFTLQEAAELHLHHVHLNHLRRVHGEYHGVDVEGHHVGSAP